jgi:hypothetical protein
MGTKALHVLQPLILNIVEQAEAWADDPCPPQSDRDVELLDEMYFSVREYQKAKGDVNHETLPDETPAPQAQGHG